MLSKFVFGIVGPFCCKSDVFGSIELSPQKTSAFDYKKPDETLANFVFHFFAIKVRGFTANLTLNERQNGDGTHIAH